MSPDDLLTTLDALGHPRLLVLGDVILDRYTWGDAERISQEAPVIVLRADSREDRPGGGANVCHMLRGLQAEVACVGVVGDDSDGRALRLLLAEAGVDVRGLLVDPARPTTRKERFMGRAQGRHPHQILRVDSEVRSPATPAMEAQLIAAVAARISSCDALLISDYAKGACTPAVLRAAIDAARAARVPVIVDPVRLAPGRREDYARYRGATTMTPNRLEAELATGVRIVTAHDAYQAARSLCRDCALDFGVVTLDRDGMALVTPDATLSDGWRGECFPTSPRAVYDITGAGDIVLAMIGAALACGLSPADALRLGNVAGGLEVEKIGVAVVTRDEIRQRLQSERHAGSAKLVSLDQLLVQAGEHRQRGQRIVFTNGCFDLLHVGHVSYLEEAAHLGDLLVVGVNSDLSVRKLKGPTRPVIKEHDRAAMLAALACVDYVLVFDEDTPEGILRALRPDVLVKGGTYAADQVVGHEIVTEYGGRVCVTGMVDGVSTTRILNSLAAREPASLPRESPAAPEPSAMSEALSGPHFSVAAAGSISDRSARAGAGGVKQQP